MKINSRTGYKQQKFLHFVRDAVYAVAHALHDVQVDVCGKSYVGMCDKMRHIDGELLSKYLNNVTFKGECAFCANMWYTVGVQYIFNYL